MHPERQNNDANLILTQLSYTRIYTSNVLKQDCVLEVSFAGGAEHTGLPVRGVGGGGWGVVSTTEPVDAEPSSASCGMELSQRQPGLSNCCTRPA